MYIIWIHCFSSTDQACMTGCLSRSHSKKILLTYFTPHILYPVGGFNPLWKILVNLDHLPFETTTYSCIGNTFPLCTHQIPQTFGRLLTCFPNIPPKTKNNTPRTRRRSSWSQRSLHRNKGYRCGSDAVYTLYILPVVSRVIAPLIGVILPVANNL